MAANVQFQSLSRYAFLVLLVDRKLWPRVCVWVFSALEISFWHALGAKKLNEWRLAEQPRLLLAALSCPIVAAGAERATLSGRLSFGDYSFPTDASQSAQICPGSGTACCAYRTSCAAVLSVQSY
jgi:hypothetical protein